MPQSGYRQAYIVGAYVPNGGTHMAYHLGRILQRDFGIPAIAVRVGDETPDHGVHNYDLPMPMVSLEQMEREITAADIFIANPSFSSHLFGWRLPGFKLCYVQGFSTYALLDLKFDCYVAVSDFVADYLRATYAIEVPVIPPFVDLDQLPAAPDWSQRPADQVLAYRKDMDQIWEPSWQRLREIVALHAPHINFAEPLDSGGSPQQELLAKIGSARYFLTLSAAEGFGLVPLEAMAMGALVIGYDGYGGRHYMRPNENCAVAPYPQIEHVADLLIAAVNDPVRSAEMAGRGRETAVQFTYAAFRLAWIDTLSTALKLRPLSAER
jgi:glycosyltransferase involved in cell wall biosynthesis